MRACAQLHRQRKKEAIPVEVDMVVVKLDLGLYWSDVGKQRIHKKLLRCSFRMSHWLYRYIDNTRKY